MKGWLLSVVFLMCASLLHAQVLIPFEYTSEEDNRLIRENDSFKVFVATGDTSNSVCISEEYSLYRLVSKSGRTIASGAFIFESDKYLQDGKWAAFYENGRIRMTGYFQRGIPVGTWQEFNKNGGLKTVSNYGLFVQSTGVTSCLSGTYQEYYNSGKLKINGFYAGSLVTVHDTVTVADPVTGQDVIKVINRKKLTAVKSGRWEYFEENGDLEKKEDL